MNYLDTENTLTDERVTAVHDKILEALQQQGATIRYLKRPILKMKFLMRIGLCIFSIFFSIKASALSRCF